MSTDLYFILQSISHLCGDNTVTLLSLQCFDSRLDKSTEKHAAIDVKLLQSGSLFLRQCSSSSGSNSKQHKLVNQ